MTDLEIRFVTAELEIGPSGPDGPLTQAVERALRGELTWITKDGARLAVLAPVAYGLYAELVAQIQERQAQE